MILVCSFLDIWKAHIFSLCFNATFSRKSSLITYLKWYLLQLPCIPSFLIFLLSMY